MSIYFFDDILFYSACVYLVAVFVSRWVLWDTEKKNEPKDPAVADSSKGMLKQPPAKSEESPRQEEEVEAKHSDSDSDRGEIEDEGTE